MEKEKEKKLVKIILFYSGGHIDSITTLMSGSTEREVKSVLKKHLFTIKNNKIFYLDSFDIKDWEK